MVPRAVLPREQAIRAHGHHGEVLGLVALRHLLDLRYGRNHQLATGAAAEEHQERSPAAELRQRLVMAFAVRQTKTGSDGADRQPRMLAGSGRVMLLRLCRG